MKLVALLHIVFVAATMQAFIDRMSDIYRATGTVVSKHASELDKRCRKLGKYVTEKAKSLVEYGKEKLKRKKDEKEEEEMTTEKFLEQFKQFFEQMKTQDFEPDGGEHDEGDDDEEDDDDYGQMGEDIMEGDDDVPAAERLEL